MAPPPADLRKIGIEGFDLIDKIYGPSRRSSSGSDAFHGRREHCWVVYEVPNDHVREEPAVKYPKGKPQNRWASFFISEGGGGNNDSNDSSDSDNGDNGSGGSGNGRRWWWG
ncbi:hypothetical protein E2542_SST01312 [Spatholobus suberectus]|nr:hypothetical protein E2542_SST01312 [Spatholobus suberectus]